MQTASCGRAILVVSFGTSYNETRARTIGAIEDQIAKEYPDWEVRRAFTSRMVIKKLLRRDGERVDHITDAMERLISDGIRTAVVQPTHIMNGMEYDDMIRAVSEYRDRFDSLSVGRPLLTSAEDYVNAVSAIASTVLKEAGRETGTAVVLMGHGSEHYANSSYSQLYLELLLSGFPDVYVTTVEGFPDFEDTVRLMDGKDYRDAVLFPFMLVAGDHAENDMAGDDEGSLKSVMESHGCKVRCIMKGLGEYREFRDIFVAHVHDAMRMI
ncbi:MAG: sirohydrochlorin cobaltochelatase [Candidatus Methanoplasma sp.]|jgi:sirohydrochlorin cobaltochelatase|nr:sirohydrochlorin cobaltochelatase [Candidatus Methanoplasma sp.]